MTDTESYQQHKIKKYFLRILEEKLAFIIAIPLIAILITVFIFHFYRVDGISMENTFQDHNLLIVEKLGKTEASILRKDYLPKRYDVIVFKEPSYSTSEELVKRVIGLPGDTVEIKNKKIIVYNAKNPGGFEADKFLPYYSRSVAEDYQAENGLKFEIKKGEVFVMGDNRPNSDDSRLYGPIQTKNIVGKVIVRLLPLNKALIL